MWVSVVAKKKTTFQITSLIIVITQLQINSVVTPTTERDTLYLHTWKCRLLTYLTRTPSISPHLILLANFQPQNGATF